MPCSHPGVIVRVQDDGWLALSTEGAALACFARGREGGVSCSAPAAYGRGRGPVVARETHMSWVFLAGDEAYKLKKPIRLSLSQLYDSLGSATLPALPSSRSIGGPGIAVWKTASSG